MPRAQAASGRKAERVTEGARENLGAGEGSHRAAVERRQWQRLPLAVPVFARGLDGRGRKFLEFTATLNIGAGGALVAMRHYVPPLSEVLLEIPAAPLPRLSTDPESIRRLPAEVLRVGPARPPYLWAVRFRDRIALS
jgi:hypothetical protein